MSSFYAILVENVTKIRNKKKKSSKLGLSNCATTRTAYFIHELKKYRNLIVKSTSLCLLGALFLLVLIVVNLPLNRCCLDFTFLERLMQASGHGISFGRILKHVIMSIICLYVFNLSHTRLKSSVTNTSELFDKLFVCQTSFNSGKIS